MELNDVKNAYAKWSTTYDKDHSSNMGHEITAVEEIVVNSLLRNIEYNDVFDAASGTGRYALRLAADGKKVTATDQSIEMLDKAKEKADKMGLRINFKEEELAEISSEDASFDLVLCMLALAHVKEINQPCRELVRVLRPGGFLIISDIHPNIQAEWGPDHKLYLHGEEIPFPAYHTDINEYIDAVTAAGAEVQAVIDVPMQQQRGLLPGPFVLLARKPENRI